MILKDGLKKETRLELEDHIGVYGSSPSVKCSKAYIEKRQSRSGQGTDKEVFWKENQ